jgi:serine/threonine-protein kinase
MNSPLSPDRWKTIEPIIDAAIELKGEERREYVSRTCHSDPKLEAEIERLLAAYDREDALLEYPAADLFSRLLDDAATSRLPEILNGRYRIDKELGRGGMATVFLAYDVRHDRHVAVKVLDPDFAAALGAERFLAEIKVTARLQHPNILPLHDSGEADGLLFYVMPYVAGGSLRQHMEQEKQLPIGEAIRIAQDVASALDAAHSRGVIHRDIKPENILLQDGTAVVADFGIALAVSEASPRLTRSGLALGTPQYMSPEQASGEVPIDGRSDIYALGTVLFEMLAGEAPFVGMTRSAVLAKRAALPAPPVRVLRSAVSATIDAAVARALSRERVDRYRTPGDFAKALQHSLEQTTTQPARRHRTTTLAGLAGVAALALTVFVGWRLDAVPPLDTKKIVVLPFEVTSADVSLNGLAERIASLLKSMLTGEGGPIAVNAPRTALTAWNRVSRKATTTDAARDAARQTGALEAVTGNIFIASGRVILKVNLVDARGRARELRPVTGSVDSLEALLDVLLKQILLRHAGVPERIAGDLSNRPLLALRAYLDGRAAARHAHNPEAIRNYNRALDIDSTFARAALDLAIATGKVLRDQSCMNGACASGSNLPGYSYSGIDDRSFERGVDIAWAFRATLDSRDSLMLEAVRGAHYPRGRDARETFADLERAAMKVPERADAYYLLGLLMLQEGTGMGYSDALARAASYFSQALVLDSEYIAPYAGLADAAAYQGDETKLRRMGADYLSRDSVGPAADYVRWRVATGTNDIRMLREIHQRFDSLDLTTLRRIVSVSLLSGVALADADTAAMLLLNRATGAHDRGSALIVANVVALNRGRPHQADSLQRLRQELLSEPYTRSNTSNNAALFVDGDSAVGEAAARERAERLARDTLLNPQRRSLISEAFWQSLWEWKHGRMAEAQALVRWIRHHGGATIPAGQKINADITDMLIATSQRRNDAPSLRALVDTESRGGCCGGVHPSIYLLLASAYELSGNESAALSTLRRGKWVVGFLPTILREEGRLAARAGDRDGAIRAYQHYLALRSDPEPVLRPQRDSIHAVLESLKRKHAR